MYATFFAVQTANGVLKNAVSYFPNTLDESSVLTHLTAIRAKKSEHVIFENQISNNFNIEIYPFGYLINLR